MPTGVYNHSNRITHGLSRSRFYSIYRGILSRTRFNTGLFPIYIGKKCFWNTFISFKNDMYESYLEHCNKFGIKNTTIDRINGEGDYEKENCRWATPREQANNTKRTINITFNGKTLSISNWSRELNVPRAKLMKRYRNGWPIDELLGFKERPSDSRSGENSPSWKGGVSKNKEYMRNFHKKYREKNIEKRKAYQLNWRNNKRSNSF